MEWLYGPIDSKATLWFGIQAFWWNRVFIVLQIVSAAALLLNLLDQQQRSNLHSWLLEKGRAAQQVQIPRMMRLRDIAKWSVPIALVLSACIAGIISILAKTGATMSVFMPYFLLFGIVLSAFSFPAISIIFSLRTFYIVFRAGQRYVPPLLAWSFESSRFERSLALLSFLLFLIASMGQLCLS
jgi:hypothetical protein